MPPIVHNIEIDRPPEEVFSYVSDPRASLSGNTTS